MYFVVIDIGCTECGESSNLIGIFTSKERAQAAKETYIKVNRLQNNSDHEFFIYQIEELDKIHQNSYEHLIKE
ncbi:DUF7336 domain-containing protein [Litchfieldia alkalitelluris]|uniref:DUF7336 domain-containing protein n=1 Tax=Litchfieldia alkalitelluris TaxID=304268 RepID=UPI00099698C0|nr:hypothetical protein [Litchfieldia alkalitelluris]